MQSLKSNIIGIYEKAIPNLYNWEEKIIIAKKAGYDFIEISIDESEERLQRLDWTISEREHLKKLLNKYDFEIRSMCLSGHRRFPFGSLNESDHRKSYEIIEKAIKLAKNLGIRNIQLAGYDMYYGSSNNETKSRFVEGLKYAAKLAERENIMLSIEIMDTKFIGTITKALNYVNLIKSPYLQLYPDVGNLSQWTKSLEDELTIGNKNIVAIHLKDTKPGVFKGVPFGEGTVDFREIFEILNKLKYSGPFLIEMWANNNVKVSKDKTIEKISQAKEWLIERMESKC